MTYTELSPNSYKLHRVLCYTLSDALSTAESISRILYVEKGSIGMSMKLEFMCNCVLSTDLLQGKGGKKSYETILKCCTQLFYTKFKDHHANRSHDKTFQYSKCKAAYR